MIVVDVNILAYLLIPGDKTALVEKAFLKDGEWAAPVLWRSELQNVLAGYMRRAKMPLFTALQLLDRAEKIIGKREFAITSARVMDLVAGSSCSAYDCEYVALSLDIQTNLLTTDKHILQTFPGTALSLDSFLAANDPAL